MGRCGVSRIVFRAVCFGALVAAAACVVPLAAAHVFTVVTDERLGSFRVKTDGTLGGAISAFGTPKLDRGSDVTCRATWVRHALTIDFYNLGGGDPCSRRFGFFGRAIMRGDHWRTSKGLRLGDPVARLRRLYPTARFHIGKRGFRPSGWWLVVRKNRFGLPGTSPGLLAETRNGRVTAFRVQYQRGGE
jgi:hypothetical protein